MPKQDIKEFMATLAKESYDRGMLDGLETFEEGMVEARQRGLIPSMTWEMFFLCIEQAIAAARGEISRRPI